MVYKRKTIRKRRTYKKKSYFKKKMARIKKAYMGYDNINKQKFTETLELRWAPDPGDATLMQFCVRWGNDIAQPNCVTATDLFTLVGFLNYAALYRSYRLKGIKMEIHPMRWAVSSGIAITQPLGLTKIISGSDP